MLVSDFVADPRKRREKRTVRTGHVVGAPLSEADVDDWQARAERVRAAFTRDAIRDLYDLDQLARAGADLSSPEFVRVVDAKLAELGAPPLREQARSFGAGAGPRRKALEASLIRELQAVLRVDEQLPVLNEIFERFNRLWGQT